MCSLFNREQTLILEITMTKTPSKNKIPLLWYRKKKRKSTKKIYTRNKEYIKEKYT